MWNIQDVGCLGCQMLRMWDVRDVGCSRCEILRMWNFGDIGCWEYGMFRMWGVWDVECLGCEIFVYIMPKGKSLSEFHKIKITIMKHFMD